MNVDEGMKLLRDPRVWDVELTPRVGVFAKPRPGVWRIAGLGIAATAVVALVASAVVFGSLQLTPRPIAPAVTSSPTPTETPTPTPSAISRTGLSAPTPIFGGDCSKFASDDEMAAIAGGEVSPIVQPDNDEDGIKDAESTVYRQLGVITCVWRSEQGNINLTILRNDVAPGDSNDTCASYTWGEASLNKDLCVVDVVAGGIRVSGDVDWRDHSDSRAISKRLVAYLKQADFGDAGAAPAPGVGAWKKQLQCAELSPIVVGATQVDLILDIPGTDAGSLPVEDQIRDLYSSTGCYGNSTGDDGRHTSASFTAYSDGAWQFDEAIDDLAHDNDSDSYRAVDFEGFDFAVLLDESNDDEGRNYFLVSGTNYLQVRVFGDVPDDEVIASVLAKLEAAS